MNSKRVYFVMLAAIGLLFLGLLAGTYGINLLLQKDATTLTSTKAQYATLSAQQQGLAAAKKQVAKYADLEKIAQTIVPQDKDQAAAVREIANLATESGIKQLSSISFHASTLGTPTSVAPTGSTTTPAPVSSNSSGLTQLTPVIGLPGVYQLPITITQTADNHVTYAQFYDFLTRLEQNRRTAQVSAVTLQPDPINPGNVAFTLILNEFIKP